MEELITKFFRHLQHNRLEEIRQLFSQQLSSAVGVNSFVLKKSGDTGLHLCARLGPDYLHLFRYLVEQQGANIEQRNIEGKTALHDAAQFTNLPVLRYLLEIGGNVNVLKRADWTPLMLACTKGEGGSAAAVTAVSLLLEGGADPYFLNKDGWSCLHIAAREGNIKIVEMILNHVPQEKRALLVNGKSRNGRKPLHTGVMHGHAAVVELLANETEYLEEPDNCGTTPIMDACRFGHIRILHFLLDKEEGRSGKESLVALNKQGQNCLHIAAEAGQSQVVLELVRKLGMDVNCEGRHKMTPLHWAAKEGQVDTIQVLVHSLSADCSKKDEFGRSM